MFGRNVYCGRTKASRSTAEGLSSSLRGVGNRTRRTMDDEPENSAEGRNEGWRPSSLKVPKCGGRWLKAGVRPEPRNEGAKKNNGEIRLKKIDEEKRRSGKNEEETMMQELGIGAVWLGCIPQCWAVLSWALLLLLSSPASLSLPCFSQHEVAFLSKESTLRHQLASGLMHRGTCENELRNCTSNGRWRIAAARNGHRLHVQCTQRLLVL